MKRVFLSVILIFCCSVGSAFAKDYVFGIVPQQSAHKLAQLWVPIFTYLNKQTGDNYSFTTAPDIPEFEKRLAEGVYDFAYMNPYHYTVFSQLSGYKAFAKQADKKIVGILVAHKSSQINSLVDLQGLEVVFPSPAAFAASILPRAALKKQGVIVTPKYVSSHDSVYLNVAKGFFPAGGGITRTFNNFEPALRQDLKVLWTSDQYTPHAFAANSQVADEAVARLQLAMISMSETESGRLLLESLGFKGVERAEDKDWDDVRSLEIQTLDNMLQN